MQIVILAAGKGSRMLSLTKKRPKPLIKVAGSTLLRHNLNFVKNFSPSEVLVVCGYKKKLIEKYLLRIKNEFKFKINILTNTKKISGNIYSLAVALPYIKEGLLLMNADHIYYHPEIVNKIKNSIKSKDFFAVCDFNRNLKENDMKVKTTADRKSIIIISKALANYNGGYTGMTLCSKKFYPQYCQFFKQTLKVANENTAVEAVLQFAAAEGGVQPKVCDISNLDWLEVDTSQDLQKTEDILSKLKTG